MGNHAQRSIKYYLDWHKLAKLHWRSISNQALYDHYLFALFQYPVLLYPILKKYRQWIDISEKMNYPDICT